MLVLVGRVKFLTEKDCHHIYFSQGEVPETRYACTPKGWMDQITFYKWFKGHFLRFAPSVQPLLLLLDGHSSHYCPETIRLAASERVILFVLPPNMTHLLQPLDKGGFGPLKVFWREECQRYMSDNPGQYINRYCFSSLFSKAWDHCMTVCNNRAAFKTTGVFLCSIHYLMNAVFILYLIFVY